MANFVPAVMPNYTSWRRACSTAHRPPPSSARAVAERRVLDAAIGDEGRHVAGRRHVERGVQRGRLGGGDEAAGHALHLVGGALLDRDARAVGERDVDGGGGRGAVERYAMVQRQHRERIGADLVREVAVRGNAVGPDDHEIHLRLAHQRSRRAVGDHGARDAGVHQLPGGEPRPLQHRARFVHEHLHAAPRVMREINRRERRPDPARGERPGVAMRQELRPLGDERQAGLADAAAHGAVFFPDGCRFRLETLPDGGPAARHRGRDAQHAIEGPAQVHRGRPRGAEQPRELVHPGKERLARHRPQLAGARDQTHRGGDADERRAAHLERADRIRHRFAALQIALDPCLGQGALVDDAHRAARTPRDRLNAHPGNVSAGDVGCKEQVDSSCYVGRRSVGIRFCRRSLLTGGTMRQMLAAFMAAVAITAAACSDETGPNRRLSPTLAGDSSVDSTPPGKPGPVASVTVTPSGDTVAVRDSAGFFATLRDAQGNVISDSHVKWSVADPTVARIEGEFGQSVILRALRSGSTLVTARSHGKRGSAELVVVESLPPPSPADSVASVTVMPAADTVVRGDSAIFFALLRNARGDTLSGRAVTWSVSDSTVAHVEAAFGQTVVIRTSGAGFALITATSEGKSGSAQLSVTDSAPPPPPNDSVATVSVTPDTAVVAAGDTARFFATLRDAGGNILSGRPVAWSVSDSTVARVEAVAGESVVIRALRSGSSLVTAASERKSGSGSLFVR